MSVRFPLYLAATLGFVWLSACRPPTSDISDEVVVTQVAQVAAQPTLATQPPAKPQPARKPDPSVEFFDKGIIPQIKIGIPPEGQQKLRADPRKYVACSFIEDGKTTYKKVSIKLKGAAGSFRGFDDRPALTLNMKQANGGDELYHGLDKFHLNNSVQDDSLLCELLCAQLFREAGYPASRVTHARVWINNRDLGIYVLKEGFDKKFLARNFEGSNGNLYDGGFLRDIDQDLERDEGEGPEDRADLKALLAACREQNPARRHELLAQRLDVAAFLNFTALELMTSHWDGYVQNKNNYRIYFRPSDKRAVFLPHGMDQMFGDPNFSLFHHPGTIVTNAVLQNLEWKAQYRERVKELAPLFAPAKINAKIDAVSERLRPVLAAMSADRARQFDERAKDMKNRLAARSNNIRDQLRNGPPEPLKFNAEGWARVEEWNAMPNGDAKIEEQEFEGKPCYLIETGPSKSCTASWRRKVLLPKGSYRFEALARVTGVTASADGMGKGLGLRLSGGTRENQLVGTTKWERLSHSFEIPEEAREIVLVAELRATSGSAVLDAASLRLVKTSK